jgi:hypothetical protein
MSISAKSLRFDGSTMWVELSDGRMLAFRWLGSQGSRTQPRPNVSGSTFPAVEAACIGPTSTKIFLWQAFSPVAEINVIPLAICEKTK